MASMYIIISLALNFVKYRAQPLFSMAHSYHSTNRKILKGHPNVHKAKQSFSTGALRPIKRTSSLGLGGLRII